jgi:hypothetical protein
MQAADLVGADLDCEWVKQVFRGSSFKPCNYYGVRLRDNVGDVAGACFDLFGFLMWGVLS